MKELLDFFTGGNAFIPHGHCYLWQPGVLWLNVLSDAVIAASYFSLPAALIYFASKRRDLAFKPLFIMFGVFILACGLTHVMGIVTIWIPAYWLDGGVKAVTATVSLATAVAIWPLIPKALVLPSPAQLREANTELEQANRRLHDEVAVSTAAEERFRGLLESAPDAVVIAGADGRIRLVNARTEEVFGYARDELIGQLVETLMPESLRARHVGHRQGYTRDPRARSMGQGRDLRGRRKDGGEFPVEISLSPVGSGKDLFVYAAVRDVSASRAMEQALRESEQRFRQMAETVGEVFWMTSPDSKAVLYVSPAFEQVWGRSCAEVYERPTVWLEAIHPEDAPRVLSALDVLAQGTPYDIEYRIARPDGTQRWINDHGYPRRDPVTGKVTLITGVALDVTERKRAEQRFRAVTETANDAVVSADHRGNIIYFNPAAERIFGYAATEALGQPLTLLMPERFRDPHRNGLRRFLAGGEPRVVGKTVELSGLRKDGGEFPLELSLASWRVGAEVYFTGILRDISERKAAEEAIRRLNEELEAKVQERTKQLLAAQDELVRKEKLALLGQVVGSVGHELRNPLGVMNNAVYYLKAILADADPTTKEYLDIIGAEIAGTERIVSELLDSVRTRPPRIEVADVAYLIRQALKRCTLPEQVQVRIDTPAGLPPIQVDPQQIQQVLRNLFANGIDAMPDGGHLTIGATVDNPSGMVRVTVRDTGSGIKPEQMEKLFQPLFTTKARGTGLGLVVVKNLIQANGGGVDVQSEPGKGTVFTVTLPAG